MEFKNHFNVDLSIHGETNDKPSVVEQGQAIPLKNLIERHLLGNIRDAKITGAYLNGEIDDYDLEKYHDFDIIDKVAIKNKIAHKVNVDLERIKAADEEWERVQQAKAETGAQNAL